MSHLCQLHKPRRSTRQYVGPYLPLVPVPHRLQNGVQFLDVHLGVCRSAKPVPDPRQDRVHLVLRYLVGQALFVAKAFRA